MNIIECSSSKIPFFHIFKILKVQDLTSFSAFTYNSSGWSPFVLLYVFVFRSLLQTCICCLPPSPFSCVFFPLLAVLMSRVPGSFASIRSRIRPRLLVCQPVRLPTYILQLSTSSVRISNLFFSTSVPQFDNLPEAFTISVRPLHWERNNLISKLLVWGSLLLYLMFKFIIVRLRVFEYRILRRVLGSEIGSEMKLSRPH